MIIHKYSPRCLLFILALAAIAPSVRAAENEIEVGTLMSNYVWRGLRLSSGPVYQASFTLAYKGLSFNAWGNYDFHQGRVNETDLTFAYARSIKKISLEAGVIHYGLIKEHDSDEVYVDLYADCLLQPEIALYYDFNLGTGAFLQASIGHSIRLSTRASLDLKASMGIVFQDGFMGIPDSEQEFNGLRNAEIQVSCPIKLAAHWALTMQVGASTPLSDKARQAIRNGSIWDPAQGSFNGSIVYGGITVAFSF
jgi:uncharacterized protein (TIGR02001 family)